MIYKNLISNLKDLCPVDQGNDVQEAITAFLLKETHRDLQSLLNSVQDLQRTIGQDSYKNSFHEKKALDEFWLFITDPFKIFTTEIVVVQKNFFAKKEVFYGPLYFSQTSPEIEALLKVIEKVATAGISQVDNPVNK
jgi:hypothetical protein